MKRARCLAVSSLALALLPVAALGQRPAAQQSGEAGVRSPACAECVLETIRQRRTVRRFLPTPVPDSDLVRILDAARLAPTSGNQQPLRFLVVRDRGTLDRLVGEAVESMVEVRLREPGRQDTVAVLAGVRRYVEGALSAPVYVAVLVDRQAPYPADIATDGALAAGTLMIAARALGYGTGFFTFLPEERLRRVLGFPERYQSICFTPIGVPAEWPAPPAKRDLRELVVYDAFEGAPAGP